MKKILLSVLILLFFATGCTSAAKDPGENSSIYLTAMDTVMKLTAYGPHRQEALEQAQEEIERLDAALSIGNPDSEISKLNASGSAVLSPDTAALLGRAMELNRDTEGLFDVTVYPLVKLWGFFDKNYHVPTEEERLDAMARMGSDRLTFSPETGAVTLDAGQSIDLGAIGKGYASQRAARLMKEAGVSSALLSLGGNVQCLGSKPDGSPWNIGIRDPFGDESALYAAVKVEDQAVITSGGYERFFENPETGKIYRHILDPRTGYPAQSGLSSVSIITNDGALGDGLSTALYIMGLEQATEYWRSHADSFEAILISDDGTLYATSGLKGRISSEHEVVFLSR